MRIVTWNTLTRVGPRLHNVTSTAADAIALQECEELHAFGPWNALNAATDKGKKWVSILSPHPIQPLPFPFLNVVAGVIGATQPFVMVNLWSYVAPGGYYSAFNKAVIEHALSLDQPYPLVIAGDFNANAAFARPNRGPAHLLNVELMSSNGLESAYHRHFGEEFGQETRATYFRNSRDPAENRRYHIDYVFVPSQWRIDAVRLKDRFGSDHEPLVVDVSPASPSGGIIQE